jgi:hypothetical protein
MYLWLFGLAAGLNILLGVHDWRGVFAGSLNDPDSYMRLLRIEQGIHAGHFVTVVARDDSGAGAIVEWSHLLDGLLWAMAAPLAAFIGWHRALFAAGVALGPLGAGALGAALAWAVEPFAGRRFLWSAAVASAVLPAISVYAHPGMVHYHILLLALLALTAGAVARAWEDDRGYGFCAGLAGGFAIWLTPETMPFVLMAFAAFLIRLQTVNLGSTITACAAGFFNVLAFALAIDPPLGGYGIVEVDRLSLVYVVLGLLLLAGAGAIWSIELRRERWPRAAGAALLAALILAWIAAFPGVAMGPYGLMPVADQQKFFGVNMETQPVRGLGLVVFLWPGALAALYALWRALPLRAAPGGGASALLARPGKIGWLWLYLAACALVTVILGAEFVMFITFSTAIAAALVPLALSEVSLRCESHENLAMLARFAIVLAVLGVPELARFPIAEAAPVPAKMVHYPSCSLLNIAALLAPAGASIVLGDVQATPEILYRSSVSTVGSLYHHSLAGFLRAREAWRAPPSAVEPAAVRATGAAYILFCPQPGRYALVADDRATTIWDALAGNNPPPWLTLTGTDEAGWRLYKIKP